MTYKWRQKLQPRETNLLLLLFFQKKSVSFLYEDKNLD